MSTMQATAPKFKNTRRGQEGQKAATQQTVFSAMDKLLRVDSIFTSGLPVRYVPRLGFITLLALLYIGNNHYASKNIVRLNKVNAEIEEMRVDYITLKSDYMSASKQSAVASRVQALGLTESKTPPRKLLIDQDNPIAYIEPSKSN